LLFFTDLLRNLPMVVLASIVLVAVRGLIDLAALRHFWRVSRFEFRISMVALVGVLLLGILKGVLMAVVVSILMLLFAAARPNVAFLGRIPGTRRYSDIERNADNELIPGVIVFRVEAAILYFNADHVRSVVWQKISQAESPQLAVCDLSNVPQMDIAGASMLAKLQLELSARGIEFRTVEARARIRDLLRAEGLDQQLGHHGRQLSVDQAIVEFEQATAS
jgi:sulfate permease, SulP family